MSGELVVDVGDGLKLVLHGLSVEWVEVDLLLLLSVQVDSDGPAGDVGWEDLEQQLIIYKYKFKVKMAIRTGA